MLRGKTEAETCRFNGWASGTILVGDDGYGPEKIRITAIGEEAILARTIETGGGVEVERSEGLWKLSHREWSEQRPSDKPETEPRGLGAHAVVTPSVGDMIQFGCREWEVSGAESVTCDYDSSYRYRVNLILRDHTGTPVNFATNIPNWCLD